MDIEYNGHDRNNPLDGPIARRLKEYGRVKAFVVGPRAEMSKDLHSLINCISERAAEVRWRGACRVANRRNVSSERASRKGNFTTT